MCGSRRTAPGERCAHVPGDVLACGPLCRISIGAKPFEDGWQEILLHSARAFGAYPRRRHSPLLSNKAVEFWALYETFCHNRRPIPGRNNTPVSTPHAIAAPFQTQPGSACAGLTRYILLVGLCRARRRSGSGQRDWLIDLILFGNYRKLGDAALAAFGGDLSGKMLKISCCYAPFDTAADRTESLPSAVRSTSWTSCRRISRLSNPQLAEDAPVTLHLMDSCRLDFDDGAFDRTLLFFLVA